MPNFNRKRETLPANSWRRGGSPFFCFFFFFFPCALQNAPTIHDCLCASFGRTRRAARTGTQGCIRKPVFRHSRNCCTPATVWPNQLFRPSTVNWLLGPTFGADTEAFGEGNFVPFSCGERERSRDREKSNEEGENRRQNDTF